MSYKSNLIPVFTSWRFLLLLTLLVLLPVFSPGSFAAENKYEAEGKYWLEENENMNDARKRALDDAKRVALEKAGTHIKSDTRMINYVVAKDDVAIAAAAFMRLDKIISEKNIVENGKQVFVVSATFFVDTEKAVDKMVDPTFSEYIKKQRAGFAAKEKEYIKNAVIRTARGQNPDTDIGSDNKKSIKEITRIININSNKQYAYYWRGVYYWHMGENSRALLDLNKALDLNPRDDKSLIIRANIYADINNKDLAALDFDKLAGLDRKYINVRNTFKELCEVYDIIPINANLFPERTMWD
ncbi:MAG: tetratricopeptide repeat protein [Sporomusaceae bacterium]|nr:tetratricopeptide repeat protein [Sporomusaceae bacterium]